MSYQDEFKEHELKEISTKQIKKRWFRNWYVLYQTTGYFTHKSFVFEYGKFPSSYKNYTGTWYGPFWSREEATNFGNEVVNCWNSFMMS